MTLAPLPGFPVIRDLVVDMTQFFRHYRTIMNCTEVCPKGLSPARAIEHIRIHQLRRST